MQTENLSQTIQFLKLSAIEAHQLAEVVIQSFQQERIDTSFNLFWEYVSKKREELDISERKRKHPKHLTDFFGYMQANEMYRTKFFKAQDFVTFITNSFDQSDFVVYRTMQNILLCGEKDPNNDIHKYMKTVFN